MHPVRSAAPVERPVVERPAVRLAAPAPSAATCTCGHVKQAHEHYRRGKDCAMCDCARYRRPLLRRLGVLSR